MKWAEQESSGATAPSSRLQLIARLRDRIVDTLGPLLASESSFALLDFPSYSNVGDSAIWLGTIAYLRSRGIEHLRYTSDRFTYSRGHLADRIGRGTILLSGGGNLGDLWPHHQHFREEVIASFPANRIVQLAQSIWFEDRAALARARDVFDRHPDLTLLVRDRQSLAIARREFRARSELCPDMAFCLGPLERDRSPSQPVVFLARTDRESKCARSSVSTGAVDCVDWRAERRSWLGTVNALSRRLPFASRACRWLRGPLSRTYGPLAAQRLRRGCKLLSAGRVVISDRLHGHILCILLGIPHFLLDSRYGKVRSFCETWTQGCELSHWCDSEADAWALASTGHVASA